MKPTLPALQSSVPDLCPNLPTPSFPSAALLDLIDGVHADIIYYPGNFSASGSAGHLFYQLATT